MRLLLLLNMKEIKDTYKTIAKPNEVVLYKDRGSKFYGYAFPIQTEEDIKKHVDFLKKEHYNARHWCYAWQLGNHYNQYRVNDDGEPNNSAGMPIYGQLKSFDLTNVLVVVVRYFGGTKLGVGGLIQAYKTTAKLAIEETKIVTKTINVFFKLTFDYAEMNKVMRIIKEQKIEIFKQKLETNCEYIISVRQKEASKIFNLFNSTFKVTIKKITAV